MSQTTTSSAGRLFQTPQQNRRLIFGVECGRVGFKGTVDLRAWSGWDCGVQALMKPGCNRPPADNVNILKAIKPQTPKSQTQTNLKSRARFGSLKVRDHKMHSQSKAETIDKTSNARASDSDCYGTRGYGSNSCSSGIECAGSQQRL